MANLKELIVNGVSHFIGKVFINDSQINTINGVTVGSTPKFTDTVTTATTSGNGNAVTAVTASNGALTVTKGTTFLTSHQDISGKADKTATVSTVAYDSTNKKITKTINGTTSDVVTAATLKTAMGLDNVEANQNAFSNVKVGSTTIAADSKTDTLELAAGSNVTLTPDATNDKVTIASSDYSYIRTEGDNRSVATSPSDYTTSGTLGNKMTFRGLKANSYINSPSSDVYSYLVGLRGWSDDSGGNAHELAFNNSGIYTRNGSSSTWGNWEKIYTSKNLTYKGINPLQTKTYTDVVMTANNDPNGWVYFAKCVPSSTTDMIYIKYRVRAESAGSTNSFNDSIVEYWMQGASVRGYTTYNKIKHTDYRAFYNHSLYRAKAAGITDGYGHLLGIRFTSSWNPATAANARTVTIDILDCYNCTITFFDSMTKYANAPGTGSTNYDGRSDYDGTTQGITMSGDRNDVNYYNRNYYACRTTATALYRYQLCLTKPDKSLVPINTVNNSIATNKTLTTESFNPFGDILYWASTTTYSAGANVGDGWYAQYLADIRYSFNIGGYDVASTLVARKPLYLVCSPQSDGLAKLHSSPLAQDLPTSDDGLIYIYLGQVYPDTYPYRLYMTILHPIYQYKNGHVQLYTPNSNTVNGHTVQSDVPANAVFTDTTALGSMTGTLGVGNGGTGQTTAQNAANAFIDSLGAGTTAPKDGDTYIASYADGKNVNHNGNNTYYRRPITELWTYIKGKIDANGSYANKNVFGKVKVGSSTIEADTTQDTLELVAGSNVTLTPDTTNDKVTIAVTLPIWDGTVT